MGERTSVSHQAALRYGDDSGHTRTHPLDTQWIGGMADAVLQLLAHPAAHLTATKNAQAFFQAPR